MMDVQLITFVAICFNNLGTFSIIADYVTLKMSCPTAIHLRIFKRMNKERREIISGYNEA